jgi:hypothetical protein
MNVSASIVGSSAASQGPGSVLSPVDRVSEVLFG